MYIKNNEQNDRCYLFNIKLRYATFGFEPKEKGVLKLPFFYLGIIIFPDSVISIRSMPCSRTI